MEKGGYFVEYVLGVAYVSMIDRNIIVENVVVVIFVNTGRANIIV